MSRSRNIRVRNGIDATSITSRIAGDKARRKGLARRRCVVNVRVEEVVCISRGKLRSRRPVIIDKVNGTREKRRSLQVYV